MRTEPQQALLALLLSGCAVLARPEGDGGWSPARRHEELGRIAARAGVALEPEEPPAAPASPGPLTLADVIALASRGSRPVALAAHDLAAAAARVRDARGRLLPSVTGAGRYSWYTDPQTVPSAVPAALLPPGVAVPTIEIRAQEFGVVNGTATVPLDLWGELRHVLTAAQAGYRGEGARVWATTLAQQVAAIRAYFNLLEAERLREVVEQTLVLEREQLAHAEQRYGAGRLTRNELLVVQVTLKSAEQQLVQRTLAIDQARWTLNQILGLPVDAPTAVVDVRARPSIPAVADALRASYGHNPALAALVEQQQRLEDTARALARGRLPRFAGGGAIDYNSSDILQPNEIGSAFVGFTWDLGTDGRRAAQLAEARIEADRNRVAIEQELRELESAVRLTQRAAGERLAALAAAEAAVGQAEENVRIRRQQFDAGRATSDDVLDADALLASQRATLASALYQAHTRRAELQQLMGLPLDAVVAAAR